MWHVNATATSLSTNANETLSGMFCIRVIHLNAILYRNVIKSVVVIIYQLHRAGQTKSVAHISPIGSHRHAAFKSPDRLRSVADRSDLLTRNPAARQAAQFRAFGQVGSVSPETDVHHVPVEGVQVDSSYLHNIKKQYYKIFLQFLTAASASPTRQSWPSAGSIRPLRSSSWKPTPTGR